MATDKFKLARFIEAQEQVMPTVLAELRQGRKDTHWMWFVFPQLFGLGASPRASFYGIRNLDEARAYLAHPDLGCRLKECVALVLGHQCVPADEIFGTLDALKFRSSMTLFAKASNHEPIFQSALDAFFGGEGDSATLSRLKKSRRK